MDDPLYLWPPQYFAEISPTKPITIKCFEFETALRTKQKIKLPKTKMLCHNEKKNDRMKMKANEKYNCILHTKMQ